TGRAYVRQLYAQLQQSGEAVQQIMRPRPGSTQAIVKTNFAKAYRPWDMLVMTGMFGDDIAVERGNATLAAALPRWRWPRCSASSLRGWRGASSARSPICA